MNLLIRRSSSIASAASKQTVAALLSTEALRSPSVIPAESLSSASSGEICSSYGGRTSDKFGLSGGLGCRGFHFSSGPLGFRSSDVARAEYAVEDFSDEEKSQGKKVDEGLEISKLGIAPEIVGALSKRGITKLFPIQRAVLEPAMQGRDMIGRARTGTGKTLAFGIPIMDKIVQFNAKHGRGRNPLAMVLAPTRELAKQVEKEFRESAPTLDTICVYGGTPISQQMNTLNYGVDVVVGTPGRVIDLLKRGALNLSEVQFIVLDEADQMLAVGFAEDVEIILEKLPKKRQGMMFSATMPTWIRKLTQRYLNNPLTIDLVGDSDQKLAEGITLFSIPSDNYGKPSILGPLITEHAKGGKCIVFTQTKRDADRLASSMGRSYKCEALHGDISQSQRERTLAGFRDGHFNILVATDVAARGLDIPNVDLVVHYELPNNSEIFVHRSGRTGRAGKKGKAILIYSEHQMRAVRVIENDVGCKFTELPKIAVEAGTQDLFGDMGGSRFGSYGSGRTSGSSYGRSSSGFGFGRSSGFGGSSGGYGDSASGRFGSFGGSGSSRSGGSGFGRSSGFGDSGSGRSGGFGDSSFGRSSGPSSSSYGGSFGKSSGSSSSSYGRSGSSRFGGGFGSDSADDDRKGGKKFF